MKQKTVFHIDVNSAFLSWTAADRLRRGEKLDLRTVPSVVAGDSQSRHAIILAKSIPAGKMGVKTGTPLFQALQLCPELRIVPPDYELYVENSRKLIRILRQEAPEVEQYSIDEAFVDMTGVPGKDTDLAAHIAGRVREELGFTVNIGISENQLLAKMAGDLEKPDKIHTIYRHEIQSKMWPLPVGELFSVGRSTERILKSWGIHTIGQLAAMDPALLRSRLHSHGVTIWEYANGRCGSITASLQGMNKSYGNSVTTASDVCDAETAKTVLLSLSETVAARMRRDGQAGREVTVRIRSKSFEDSSRQLCLETPTDVTEEIWHWACRVLSSLWDGKTPLRQLGVQMSRLSPHGFRQLDLYEGARFQRLEKLDRAVDSIRSRYGELAVQRAVFLGSDIAPMGGGLHPQRRTGVTKPVPPLESNPRHIDKSTAGT